VTIIVTKTNLAKANCSFYDHRLKSQWYWWQYLWLYCTQHCNSITVFHCHYEQFFSSGDVSHR